MPWFTGPINRASRGFASTEYGIARKFTVNCLQSEPRFNIKITFPGKGIPIIKVFIMGIPEGILVKTPSLNWDRPQIEGMVQDCGMYSLLSMVRSRTLPLYQWSGTFDIRAGLWNSNAQLTQNCQWSILVMPPLSTWNLQQQSNNWNTHTGKHYSQEQNHHKGLYKTALYP